MKRTGLIALVVLAVRNLTMYGNRLDGNGTAGFFTFDGSPVFTSMQFYGDVFGPISGKGMILKNAAGTVTKRVRLNDTGDGLIFENP